MSSQLVDLHCHILPGIDESLLFLELDANIEGYRAIWGHLALQAVPSRQV